MRNKDGRAALPLRRNRDFRLLWLAGVTSELGFEVTQIALPLLVLATTGSAGYAGVVTSAGLVAYTLFMLAGGTLADRFDRRKLMAFCDFCRAGLLAILTVLVMLDAVGLMSLVTIVVVLAALEAVFAPTQDASIRRLVPVSQLHDAYAIDNARSLAGKLVGPAIGGGLFAVGRSVPFAGNIVTYLVSGFLISAIKQPLQAADANHESNKVGWRSTLEGFRFIFANPLLRVFILMSTGTAFVIAAFPLAYIASLQSANVGPELIGIMLAAYGVAGVGGALAAPRILRLIAPRLLLIIGAWLVPVLMVVLALTSLAPIVIGAACLMFFVFPSLTTLARGYLAANTPSRLQGRVFASLGVASAALSPFAPVTIGTVFESAGRPWAYATMAIVGALAALPTLSKAVINLRREDIMKATAAS